MKISLCALRKANIIIPWKIKTTYNGQIQLNLLRSKNKFKLSSKTSMT